MWPCRGCRALATDDAFRDVLIAVDTFHSEVARSAIAAGAHMVNDVSGGEFDENMHAEVRSSLLSQRCLADCCNLTGDACWALLQRSLSSLL